MLDEVGELSLRAQPKLLRALECGEVSRVGSESTTKVFPRVVAATNRKLRELCDRGQFRADLFYRLSVIEIHVPPLRDRPEDIEVLAAHFLRELACRVNGARPTITGDGLRALCRYDWPGNGRELRHAIERGIALASHPVLNADTLDLDPRVRPNELGLLLEMDWRGARRAFTELYVRSLMEKYSGNVKQAAADAGVAQGSFYKWLREFDIPT